MSGVSSLLQSSLDLDLDDFPQAIWGKSEGKNPKWVPEICAEMPNIMFPRCRDLERPFFFRVSGSPPDEFTFFGF